MPKTKVMTTREMEIFNLLVTYAMLYDGTFYPECKWGNRRECAEDLRDRLSFKIDDDDVDEMCENIRGS